MHHLRTLGLAAAAIGVGLFGLAAQAAQAAPIGGTKGLSQTTAQLDNPNAVQLVRGCHRDWRRHYVPRWNRVRWHRHVGPRCRPIRPRNVYKVRPRGLNHGCVKIGEVWICA